jgi:hypothetical protein
VAKRVAFFLTSRVPAVERRNPGRELAHVRRLQNQSRHHSQKQQHLKTLTPNKLTTVHRNGKTYYVYADPTQKQIYVGTQAENKKYQQLRKANNLAEEKTYSEAMGDWGVWEPFGY